jgi:DNA-directed RNA polymerase subunit beta
MLIKLIMPSFIIRYKRSNKFWKEAVEHIYRQLRNAEPPDEETARGIIDKFFSDQRYNLGEVGRYRIKNLVLISQWKSKYLPKKILLPL